MHLIAQKPLHSLEQRKTPKEVPLKFIFFLGRALFSLIFMLKSLEHFSQKMIDHAASLGVPLAPFLVPATGVIVFVGGLSILLGYKAKAGAWLLIIFLVPTTFMMHNFWKSETAFAATMHNYCFWKNISLLGAALMMTYTGSGPMSLETRRR